MLVDQGTGTAGTGDKTNANQTHKRNSAGKRVPIPELETRKSHDTRPSHRTTRPGKRLSDEGSAQLGQHCKKKPREQAKATGDTNPSSCGSDRQDHKEERGRHRKSPPFSYGRQEKASWTGEKKNTKGRLFLAHHTCETSQPSKKKKTASGAQKTTTGRKE